MSEKADPELSFPIITDELLPGGLICPGCSRHLHQGDPFASRPESIDEDGTTISSLTCVYCTGVDIPAREYTVQLDTRPDHTRRYSVIAFWISELAVLIALAALLVGVAK